MPMEEAGGLHSELGSMTVTPHPGVQTCPSHMCGLQWGCKAALPDTHTSGTQGLLFLHHFLGLAQELPPLGLASVTSSLNQSKKLKFTLQAAPPSYTPS